MKSMTETATLRELVLLGARLVGDDGHNRWDIDPPDDHAATIDTVAAAEAEYCRTSGAYDGGGKRGPMTVTARAYPLFDDGYDDPFAETSSTVTVGPPIPHCEPAPEQVYDEDLDCYVDVWPLHDGSGDTVRDVDDLPPADEGDEHGHAWRSPHAVVGGIEENPGVYGHAGGVTIDEVCVRCGLRRLTDTWDQSYTGTGEPVETVRYGDDDVDEAA